jgi:preprotein translocase subunit Sss1
MEVLAIALMGLVGIGAVGMVLIVLAAYLQDRSHRAH